MAVTVRLFAALRDAAGVAELDVPAGPVPAIIATLSEHFGEPFTTRVTVASVLIDGALVRRDADLVVHDGAQVALLPPFSGGSSAVAAVNRARERRVHRLLLVGSLLVPALLVLGVLSSRATFSLVVVVIAAGALVDMHTAFAGIGVRTVLPTGAVLALTPVLLLVFAPDSAAEWVPGALAVGTMVTFLLAIASQRRGETAMIVGSTLLSGLLVAFGAGGVLLLHDALQPSRVIGVLGLLGATDAAAVIAARPGARPRMLTLAAVAVALPAAIVFQSTAGWARNPAPVAGLALLAIVVAVSTARLRQVLRRPDLTDRPRPALLIGTADAVLVGVPLTLVWLQVLAL